MQFIGRFWNEIPLPFRKKQLRLEHPAGLRAQPGPVVQTVAGDPQEPAAADEQRAAATLCPSDLVVDEVFFELLGAGHAQGRKPVSRTEIADHHGEFDGRHVHVSRLRAATGKLRDRGGGHLGQADAIPGFLDRQAAAAGQAVLEVGRHFIRPRPAPSAFRPRDDDLVPLAADMDAARQVQGTGVRGAPRQLEHLLDMGEGDPAQIMLDLDEFKAAVLRDMEAVTRTGKGKDFERL